MDSCAEKGQGVRVDERALKRCPFCGGEAAIYEEIPGGYIVQCHDCCGQIGIMTKERAIAAWNTRAELGSGTCNPVETEVKLRIQCRLRFQRINI